MALEAGANRASDEAITGGRGIRADSRAGRRQMKEPPTRSFFPWGRGALRSRRREKLALVKLPVGFAGAEQFVVLSLADDGAPVHDDDRVG